HRAAFLCLLDEPPTELRKRRDEIPFVLHRRRRRQSQRTFRGEHVDRLVRNRSEERQLLDSRTSLEQAAQRTRILDRAREQMRSGLLALLEHRYRNLAEALADLRRILEQLAE